MTPDWALVELTAVYVVATVFIVVFNNRVADATRKQVEELQRQFREQNRPYVQVGVENVRGGLICLSIENTGNSPARDVCVSLDEEFVGSVPDSNRQECLRKLTHSAMYLSPRQKLYCCLGGPACFQRLKDVPLFVDVTYGGGENTYRDHVEVNLRSYEWALVYESPLGDISSYVKKMSEVLERIQGKLA